MALHSPFPASLKHLWVLIFHSSKWHNHSPECTPIQPNGASFGQNNMETNLFLSSWWPFDWMGSIFGWINASFLLHSFLKASNSFRTLRGLWERLEMYAKASNTRSLSSKPSKRTEITMKQPKDKNKLKSRVMCIVQSKTARLDTKIGSQTCSKMSTSRSGIYMKEFSIN